MKSGRCPRRRRRGRERIALIRDLETIADDRAPRFSPGSVAPGGSRIIDAQSDCPFQAVARHRLDARAWPDPLASLSPQERGTLVHLSMAAFWSATRDHATLSSLDSAGEKQAVEIAVEIGLGAISASSLAQLAGRCSRRGSNAAGASRCMLGSRSSAARPPFAVEGVEAATEVNLASLTFRVRSDRVDALGDGGTAIVDFKTGKADKPGRWFDARPAATQLGMYVLAQRDAQPEVSVRAAVYAELRPDAVAAVGVAADPAAWPRTHRCPQDHARRLARAGGVVARAARLSGVGNRHRRRRRQAAPAPLACNTCRLHAALPNSIGAQPCRGIPRR